MRLYRCNNCGQTFEETRPRCQKCNIDPAQNPRFRGIVVLLEIIHWDPPTHIQNIGQGLLACDPSKPVLGHRASGEPGAVNCPACRKTPGWQAAYWGNAEMLEGQDHLVEVDKGVVYHRD